MKQNVFPMTLTGVMSLAAVPTMAAQLPAEKVQKDARPNVIVILCDDLGSSDVGFAGAKDFQTPNIDRIALQGAQCTSAYISAPYSGPSRCGLMTGRYQQRFGGGMNMSMQYRCDDGKQLAGVPRNEMMLSELMQKNGYATCAIGKWHMGNAKEMTPNSRGFDYFYGFSGGHFSYWGERRKARKEGFGDEFIQENEREVPASESTYLTDDFTDKAVDFINDNSKTEKPFFMYLAYNAPHGPFQAPQKYLDRTKHIFNAKRSIIAAMILAVDDGVGRIWDTLEAQGIDDNTMIVFLSDNGGIPEAMNYPRRAHKGNMYDGGIHTPFALYYPEKVSAGTVYDQTISSLDIFPTVAAAAGIDVSKACKNPLDGVDLLPYVTGINKGEPNHKLFWRVANGYEWAVRVGDYKLVRRYDSETCQLYNLRLDPIEQFDVAAEHPGIVARMTNDYKEWNKGMIDCKWTDAHALHQRKDKEAFMQARAKAASGKGWH